MAPTGFVQRFKGKVAFPVGGIWIGGVGVNAAGADFNALTGVSGASTKSSTEVLRGGGANIILSTAGAVYSIADPIPGRPVAIHALPGTTNWMVKGQTATVTFIGGSTAQGGSTIATVMKSTVANIQQVVDLVGISTAQYLFLGSNSTLNGAGILFSTAT